MPPYAVNDGAVYTCFTERVDSKSCLDILFYSYYIMFEGDSLRHLCVCRGRDSLANAGAIEAGLVISSVFGLSLYLRITIAQSSFVFSAVGVISFPFS